MTKDEERPAHAEPAWLRPIARVEIALACVFLLLMFLGVIWQVLGRYMPEVGWPGAGEIARYSLVGMTFIMTGFLIGNNGQVTVSIIDSIVKGRAFIAVRLVSALILVAICGWLTAAAWELVSSGFTRTTTVIQIPMGYLFLLPLVGFGLGTIRSIVKVLTVRRPEADALTFDEAEEAL